MTFITENRFVMLFRAEDADITVQKMDEFQPAPYTVLGWQVEDIRKTVSDLAGKGVVFEKYEWMEQDNFGIWKSPDASVAWFKDPDGNVLSVSQH